MNLFYKEVVTKVGKLKIVAHDHALLAILWENEKPNRVKLHQMIEKNHHPLIQKAEKQLLEYLDHQRTSFDIPIEFQGTDFQKEVWNALKSIPYGKTVSYAYLAEQINRPKAVRAAGTAIGKNPLSIVIPCHRVIGTDGSLTGFAGGLKTKAFLLNLEIKTKTLSWTVLNKTPSAA